MLVGSILWGCTNFTLAVKSPFLRAAVLALPVSSRRGISDILWTSKSCIRAHVLWIDVRFCGTGLATILTLLVEPPITIRAGNTIPIELYVVYGHEVSSVEIYTSSGFGVHLFCPSFPEPDWRGC